MYFILNYKVIVSLVTCFLFSTIAMAQKNKFSIGLRVPVQIEFQKEDIAYPIILSSKEQIATVLNYGIDCLAEKEIDKKISAYIGIGYFRDKFNFKKFYDHRLLNIGTDSIPLGTATHNYIYHLIRFPFGFFYTISTIKRSVYKIGGEIIFNYSFQKIYNGGKPFPDANNKVSKFQYSGNSINLFACIAIPITSYKFLELEPYIRVYNTYKKDEILYENPKETISHTFDALGLSIKYSLTQKPIK